MEMYRSTWENHIHVLTEAVDDITSIDDFLAVSESHILEDVNKCIIALREQNADNLDHAAGAIRGRASRVAHIVSGEMDNYEPGAYTEGVMTNVQYLTKNGLLFWLLSRVFSPRSPFSCHHLNSLHTDLLHLKQSFPLWYFIK
nr:catenin alpha-3-like isoform X2 [Columba livia]